MVAAGFLRVLRLASGVLLLLATITTTLVQPAGAYSSYLTSTSGTGSTTGGGATGGTTGTTDAPGTSDATTADGTTEEEEDAVTSGEISERCSTEISACSDDETCSICASASSNSQEYVQCHLFNTLTTSAEGCEVNMEAACCLDELTEIDCLENEAFLGRFACILEILGCSTEVTCDDYVGDGGADTASDGATATTASFGHGSTATVVVGYSCAFMVLWPLLWV